MPLSRPRFTIRHLLLAVAIAAVSLGVYRGIEAVLRQVHSWQYLPTLQPGQAVLVLDDHYAPDLSLSTAMGGGTASGTIDRYTVKESIRQGANRRRITSGTFAIVSGDTGDGDDSGVRPVVIRLVGGSQGGSVVAIPRNLLGER